MPPLHQSVVALSLFAALATPALADLTLLSAQRSLHVYADTPAGTALDTEKTFEGPGSWKDSNEGYAILSPNVVAGYVFQRSTVPQTLALHTSAFLQGSSALVATVADDSPFDAHASSWVSYIFEPDVTTQVRFVWALEGRSFFSSDHPTAGGAAFSITQLAGGVDGKPNLLYEQRALPGQINDGFTTWTFEAGSTYKVFANASNRLAQGEWPNWTGKPLFPDTNQSSAYTVSMSVIPAPAAALPLAMAVGGLTARRKRIP